MAGSLWVKDPTWKPFYAPYHISLHGPICIWAIFDPLWPRVGSIYGHFGGKNRAIMTGWLQGNVSAWKLFYAPYHISLYGQTWLRAIFDLSMHPYGTGEVQTMAIMEVKTLHGQKWIRVIFHLSTHIYGTGEIQSMVITRLIVAGWLQDKEYTDTRCTLHTVYFSFVFMLDV